MCFGKPLAILTKFFLFGQIFFILSFVIIMKPNYKAGQLISTNVVLCAELSKMVQFRRYQFQYFMCPLKASCSAAFVSGLNCTWSALNSGEFGWIWVTASDVRYLLSKFRETGLLIWLIYISPKFQNNKNKVS